MPQPYSELPNRAVQAANGVTYAYRDTGGSDGTVPLVLLQHFRGNLDNWDPALAGLIPAARLKIYPDSAHGFLFQHHAEFAADVTDFLS
jgi:pimeloyl-ACP methyl ester carboxylesterase